MGRFVKLDKDILKHPLYKSDRLAISVYVHLICTCVYKRMSEYGIELKKGERLTSYRELANEMGVDKRTIKDKINLLVEHGLLLTKDFNVGLLKKKKITVKELATLEGTKNDATMIHPMYHDSTSNVLSCDTQCNIQDTSNVPSTPINNIDRKKIDRSYNARSARETPTEQRFLKFLEWQEENAPELLKMKKPLRQDEFQKLLKLTGGDAKPIENVLLDMANLPYLYAKYNSVYRTAKKWIERDIVDYGNRK